jgi:universal stress protein A
MMAIERILVPIDFSPSSLRALDEAVEFSRPYEAQVVVMFVVERGYYGSPLLVPDPKVIGAKLEKAATARLSRIQQQLERRGVDCRTVVRFGVAYQAILDEAEKINANLIVIATHGRTGIAHFLLGSVAERVIRGASCPVLVIRTVARPRAKKGNQSATK